MKFKKWLSLSLCAAMALTSLTACGGDTNNSSAGQSDGDITTIKVFSNLTDRTSGQGLIEQTLFDNYMDENPNIKIEVEALDDESYKTKFKAYASGSGMPDLVNIWCSPSFLDEVVAADILAPLNEDDYADYGFNEGAFSGVTYDGKLYGLPRNTDVLGFYYNKDMFEQYGLEVPTTWDELLTVCETLKSKGVAAISMDGQEGWPIAHFINSMAGTVLGADTYDVMLDSIKNGDYSNEVWKTVVSKVADNADTLFQTGFETTDYGTSMNLFLNKQAGMFFMGSWEMSIDTKTDFEVGHFTMPDVDGDGQGVIGAYNGGGYAVSQSSQVKEEAIKLLNYMFEPENWTKLCWENGVCMSAQDFSEFLTGNETQLQTEIINNLNNATGTTGMTYNDLGSSEYKTVCETSVVEVAAGMISVDDYLAGLAAVK